MNNYNYNNGYPYNNYGYNNNYLPNTYNLPTFQPNGAQTNQGNIINTYAYVNGLEGAKSFQIKPNSTMMLMDSDNPFIYMKTSNAMGQSVLRYFAIKEVSEEQVKNVGKQTYDEFVSKKDFEGIIQRLKLLEEKLNQTTPISQSATIKE